MPALRLVRLPAQPGHQPVGEPDVGRVAHDGVDSLERRNRVEHRQRLREMCGSSCRPSTRRISAPENSASAAAGCSTANNGRPRRGNDSAAPAATTPAATPASARAANDRPQLAPSRLDHAIPPRANRLLPGIESRIVSNGQRIVCSSRAKDLPQRTQRARSRKLTKDEKCTDERQLRRPIYLSTFLCSSLCPLCSPW